MNGSCPQTSSSLWESSFGISFSCYQSLKGLQLWVVPNRQHGWGPTHVLCAIQQNCGCQRSKMWPLKPSIIRKHVSLLFCPIVQMGQSYHLWSSLKEKHFQQKRFQVELLSMCMRKDGQMKKARKSGLTKPGHEGLEGYLKNNSFARFWSLQSPCYTKCKSNWSRLETQLAVILLG